MAEKKYKHKIVLFDAHAILHRAYHALPDFTSSKGEPTGGLYGLASMLIRIIADLKPDYMVACYDLAAPTFRKQVYKNYKATRSKVDSNLIAQIDRSKDIFEAFGIPVISLPGFEADDIIGTLVEKLKDHQDLQIIIASGDMDTTQLVQQDKVVVYTLKKGLNDTIVYDEKGVRERFGFAPEYVPDYKGLRGDPSDNIIGIEGIGEKTATTLIQKFGSIEDIYKKLKKSKKPFEEAGIKPRIIELLLAGEEEALFSKTLATIRRDADIKYELPDKVWNEIFDIKKVEELFIELDFRSLLERVRRVFANKLEQEKKQKEEDVEKIEPEEFRKLQIAFWLLNSDVSDATMEDIYRLTKTSTPTDAKNKMLELLEKQGLRSLYEEIELPLLPILKRAEERGILVDVEYLKNLSIDYHRRLDKSAARIYELAGVEFNINSPKQLGEIIFDKLKLTAKGLHKTASGARSTRESELEKLIDAHPIIEEILNYRELQKLLSTYIDNIPTMVDAEGRLHSHLNQAGTTTGRMSSSNPNLQNIPAREGLGVAIRNGFIATPGYKLVSFDYSQIEMRILAELSGDEDLIKIFQAGKDVHTAVASRVFQVKEEEVTKDMRRQAKVINFGIIYGMGVNALRANLGSSRADAQKFYDDYFAAFPKIRSYFDRVKDDAARCGYTVTLFGRRRYFPGFKSHIPFIRASAERMAMNAPLQGTAADIVKIAMRETDRVITLGGYTEQAWLLLQIHDELVFEIKDNLVDKLVPLIKKAMEECVSLKIPLTTNVGIGQRWGELKT